MSKRQRVVLGVGEFGFESFGKSIQLWTADNKRLKTFNLKRLRDLDGLRVRIVAEVIK